MVVELAGTGAGPAALISKLDVALASNDGSICFSRMGTLDGEG